MITTADIEKLADLARIDIPTEEKEVLAKEIDAILGYVSELQQASAQAPEQELTHYNIFRDDAHPHESGVFTDALLAAAPDRDGQYFKVKKIL